jgi:glyceraldehyde 3-phosphate dehydrogenase
MTTIHAYTQTRTCRTRPQRLGARAAAINLVPITGRRRDGVVLPELNGKLGVAVRAPIPTGSITDLTAQLGRDVSVDDVNAAYKAAAESGPLQGYLQYSTAALVSTDINESQYSCIFDSGLTMAGGNLAKVFGWYDNEWGYSCRLVDLTNIVAKSI